jgi:hypothetical protein
MGYLIGTDEAGYGPNLGPLVISATLWEAPDDVGPEDFFDRVGRIIAPQLEHVAASGPWVAMADSKKLYSPGRGLRHLERGLWASLGLLGYTPKTWRAVWQSLAPDAVAAFDIRTGLDLIPWYAGYDRAAPFDIDAAEIAPVVDALRTGLADVGVRLLAMQSRAVLTPEFNDLVDRHGSKGALLSHATIALAARMIDGLPAGSIRIVCDKHGGRNRYGDLLAAHFPDAFIEIHGEGRQRSVYRFGPPDRRVEVCFRVKAEACLPAALASMASKYLRELAMQAFNAYWLAHVPGVQPTAGYPQDAKRFRVDVAAAKKRLGIDDRIFWRQR